MIDVNLSEVDAKILAQFLDSIYWEDINWDYREREVIQVVSNKIKTCLDNQTSTTIKEETV